MKIFKPPTSIKQYNSHMTIFLAGSIAMGTAENWQREMEKEFADYSDKFLSLFNPRRDVFDVTMEQSIDNPQFKEQVLWELDGLNRANIIFMYLHPDTSAPMSLLELGLFAENSSMVLVCPDGFYRKGNIEILAEQFDIPLFHSLEDGIVELRRLLAYEYEFFGTTFFNE